MYVLYSLIILESKLALTNNHTVRLGYLYTIVIILYLQSLYRQQIDNYYHH